MPQEMKPGFVPFEMKTTIVKVTSYDNKCLCGTMFNPLLSCQTPFYSVAQFLFLTEDLLNRICSPASAMDMRRFRETPPQEAPAAQEVQVPPLATFRLSVLFRQNASWQGRLVWLEGSSESAFRSVLELLRLMDSVLSD